MSTFWERATGFGAGAGEPLDLDDLQATLLLRFYDNITVSQAKQLLGLTPAQGVEFDAVLDSLPGNETEASSRAARIKAVFRGARRGISSLDSIDNVMIALGFDPPAPPLP